MTFYKLALEVTQYLFAVFYCYKLGILAQVKGRSHFWKEEVPKSLWPCL